MFRKVRRDRPDPSTPVYASRSDKRVGHKCLLMRPDGRPADLKGMYRGASLFMILGGPSLTTMPLNLLNGRGITTMCVNNSWLMHRPNLWVGVDPPERFAYCGWRDPSILKFTPQAHATLPLRTATPDGTLTKTQTRPCDCPNTYFFVREDYFDPSTFWSSDMVQWGTLKKVADAVGVQNSRSVMLAAFKMAGWLGFSRVFLVGADFRMSADPSISPYAWKEQKDQQGRIANNRMYDSMNKRLQALAFQGMPMEVFNCTPNSGLLAFPHMSIEEALESFPPNCDLPSTTEGWYKKSGA